MAHIRRARVPGIRPFLTAAAGLAAVSLLTAAGPAQAAPAAAGTTVAFWGSFAGSSYRTLLPETVALPAAVTQVATSNSTVYALLSTGKVYAWGTGAKGQLGDGQTANSFTTPVLVRLPSTVTITSLSVNSGPWDTAYAIDKSGEVWGWGANGASDLCLGQPGLHVTPVRLPFKHVTAVAGAADHTTYDAGGVLYSCGMGVYGELGDGSTADARTPVKVTGLSGTNVTGLTAGFGGAGALLSDGTYYDWGLNADGQDGNGSTTDSSVPVQVSLGGSAVEVFQGGNAPNDGSTLALLASDAVVAWGDNAVYQLGTGSRTDALSPVKVPMPPGTTYQAVASGGLTSYGVSENGTVYAWGSGKSGAVGDGSTANAPTPVRVETHGTGLISATSDVVAVALTS